MNPQEITEAPARDAEGPFITSDNAGPSAIDAASLVVEELLVEDVSIDGMCGVY